MFLNSIFSNRSHSKKPLSWKGKQFPTLRILGIVQGSGTSSASVDDRPRTIRKNASFKNKIGKVTQVSDKLEIEKDPFIRCRESDNQWDVKIERTSADGSFKPVIKSIEIRISSSKIILETPCVTSLAED